MTHQDPELSMSAVDARRRRATILQAKAAAHPLRLRSLRLCGQQPMTNKQLTDRLAHLMSDRESPSTTHRPRSRSAHVGRLLRPPAPQ